jgi:biotin synthase
LSVAAATPARDADAVAALVADPAKLLRLAEESLLDRRETISADQAYALADLDIDAPLTSDERPEGTVLDAMLDLAHRVRVAWTSDEVALESIVSGKTGGCPEDCTFCSQSSAFETLVKPQPLLTEVEVLQAAASAEAQGAT